MKNIDFKELGEVIQKKAIESRGGTVTMVQDLDIARIVTIALEEYHHRVNRSEHNDRD